MVTLVIRAVTAPRSSIIIAVTKAVIDVDPKNTQQKRPAYRGKIIIPLEFFSVKGFLNLFMFFF